MQTTLFPPITCKKWPKLDIPPHPRLSYPSMSYLNRLRKRLQGRTQQQLTKRLTVRLDPSTYQALHGLAKEYGMGVSEIAREILEMVAEEIRHKPPQRGQKRTPKGDPNLSYPEE